MEKTRKTETHLSSKNNSIQNQNKGSQGQEDWVSFGETGVCYPKKSSQPFLKNLKLSGIF